jgi:hypothetical protein
MLDRVESLMGGSQDLIIGGGGGCPGIGGACPAVRISSIVDVTAWCRVRNLFMMNSMFAKSAKTWSGEDADGISFRVLIRCILSLSGSPK